MSYEAKVLAVFAAAALALNLATVAFVWVRSRGLSDRGGLRAVFWFLLSKTLVITGALIWLVFSKSWPGIVGIGMLAIGIISKFSSTIAVSVSAIRRRRKS